MREMVIMGATMAMAENAFFFAVCCVDALGSHAYGVKTSLVNELRAKPTGFDKKKSKMCANATVLFKYRLVCIPSLKKEIEKPTTILTSLNQEGLNPAAGLAWHQTKRPLATLNRVTIFCNI